MDRAVLAKPPLVVTEPTVRHKLAAESYMRLIEAPVGRVRSAPLPVMMRLAALELPLLFEIVAA